MPQTVQTVSAARGARMLHAALAIGLVLVGAVFFFVLRVQGQPLATVPSMGLALAGLALAILTVSLAFLRGKVPARRPDQSPDDYWQANETRGPAILLWAGIQSAGVLSWLGYIMSGQLAPLVVGLSAVTVLIVLRPARLEDAT